MSSFQPTSSRLLSSLGREDAGRTGRLRYSYRPARWTPAWASSDEKLRKVIYQHLVNYCRQGLPRKEIPANATILQLEAVAQKVRNNPWIFSPRIHGTHVANTEKGLAAIWTSVVYRAYRLGWKSPDIAEELGISSAGAVRQLLARFNEIARRLYPNDCCEHHPNYRGGKAETMRRHLVKDRLKRPHRRHRLILTDERIAEVVRRYNMGETYGAIAKDLGVSWMTIRRRIMHLVNRELRKLNA